MSKLLVTTSSMIMDVRRPSSRERWEREAEPETGRPRVVTCVESLDTAMDYSDPAAMFQEFKVRPVSTKEFHILTQPLGRNGNSAPESSR